CSDADVLYHRMTAASPVPTIKLQPAYDIMSPVTYPIRLVAVPIHTRPISAQLIKPMRCQRAFRQRVLMKALCRVSRNVSRTLSTCLIRCRSGCSHICGNGPEAAVGDAEYR